VAVVKNDYLCLRPQQRLTYECSWGLALVGPHLLLRTSRPRCSLDPFSQPQRRRAAGALAGRGRGRGCCCTCPTLCGGGDTAASADSVRKAAPCLKQASMSRCTGFRHRTQPRSPPCNKLTRRSNGGTVITGAGAGARAPPSQAPEPCIPGGNGNGRRPKEASYTLCPWKAEVPWLRWPMLLPAQSGAENVRCSRCRRGWEAEADARSLPLRKPQPYKFSDAFRGMCPV